MGVGMPGPKRLEKLRIWRSGVANRARPGAAREVSRVPEWSVRQNFRIQFFQKADVKKLLFRLCFFARRLLEKRAWPTLEAATLNEAVKILSTAFNSPG